MNITIADLSKMTEKQVFEVAVKMRAQCKDKSRLEAKLGDGDDLVQTLAIALFQFKSGAVELRAGATLIEACFGIVRSAGRSNWMSDRASAYQRENDIEDGFDLDYEFDEAHEPMYMYGAEDTNLEGWEHHSIDEIGELSALDKLLIRHDTLSCGARQGMTKDMADLFGCSARTIRLRKEKIRSDMARKFNLTADLFSKKAEPKITLDKKEISGWEDPLVNFIPLPPLPLRFNGSRTVGIR